MRIVLRAFSVVDQSGENDDSQHQEEHEKTQFVGTVFDVPGRIGG